MRRPRQRRHPALGSLGGADLGQRLVRGADAADHGCRDAAAGARRPPWSPAPPVQQQPTASGVTPPVGAPGVALGVAGGRPRMADEPPTGRKTPPAAIVGSVIGLAIVVALGAWFLLLRPGPNTALASPSPSAIVVVHRPRPRPRPPPSRRTKRRRWPRRPDTLQGPDLHRQDAGGGPGTRRYRRSRAGYPVRPDDQPARRYGPVPGTRARQHGAAR